MDPQKIDSRDNPRLKHARKVRDGLERFHIFVEGLRLAEEAVRSGIEISECLIETNFEDRERIASLVEEIQNKTRDVFELSRKSFESIADTKTSQGIVLVCKRPSSDFGTFDRALSSRPGFLPLIIMLTEINNPANLGAVIRTAEAAGARGVIVSTQSADVFSSKALRGSMGSAFRLPIWAGAEISEVVNWALRNRLSLVGAVPKATMNYTEIDWSLPRLLVLGSEAHGISPEIERILNHRITIAMADEVESLNLAVAAGVLMFEARRQWMANLAE